MRESIASSKAESTKEWVNQQRRHLCKHKSKTAIPSHYPSCGHCPEDGTCCGEIHEVKEDLGKLNEELVTQKSFNIQKLSKFAFKIGGITAKMFFLHVDTF